MAILDQAELARIRVQLPRVFTPGEPVRRKGFLAGRIAEMDQVMRAVSGQGQHSIIYGERGVGKTSLAGLVHQFWLDVSKEYDLIAVRINCEPFDDYASIWASVAEEMQDKLSDKDDDASRSRLLSNLEEVVGGQATPNIIRRMLQDAGYSFIIVIDEFDRLRDRDAIGQMADTIKALSDHWVNATLVIVGVADSLDELIHEHASIDRALIQVLVRRMNTDELDAIISNGLGAVGMTIADRARAFIVRIAQGLPYYGHLLSLTSAFAAIANERTEIAFEDVMSGLRDAVKNAEATVGSAYYQATVSPRKESLYKHVLLACTMAAVDDHGYFQPASVREPLESIVGKKRPIAAFVRHLDALSTE